MVKLTVQQITQTFLVLCVFMGLFSCSATNSNGIGLKGAPPKPVTPPDVTDQTAKISETYKSTLSLPDLGFTKVLEFTESLQLVSGDYCDYVIVETSMLLQKDKTVLIDFKYKQTPDQENASSCPAKIERYVNHTRDLTFEKYANNKVALFLSNSNVEMILKANPNFKSAQVLSMDSRKLGQLDCLFVRLKLVDQNDEAYLLESHFSSMNSFLDLVDRKFISMKTSEVLSYRKLITQ